jgi:N-acetylmuramoyl-L-alanine amidase
MKKIAPMTDSPNPGRGKGKDAATAGMGRRWALGRLAGLFAVAAVSPLSLVQASGDPLAAAQAQLDAGRLQEAVAGLRRITARDPRNERAFILLGRAYAQSEQPAQALTAFRMALRINPADTHTRMLADILAQKPLPEGAGPKEKGGRHAVSRLEKSARAEREAFLAANGAQAGRTGPVRVVIDAGHGGPDAGGVAASGLREKDVALDLALQTARELQAADGGLAVFLTRMSDVPLSVAARAACADLYAADLFVSLHVPFVADAAASGLYVFTLASGGEGPGAVSRAVADFENRLFGASPGFSRAGQEGLEAGLVRSGAVPWRARQAARFAAAIRAGAGRGPFSGQGGEGSAGLALLSAVPAPAVFVAAGLLSNPGDAAVLGDAARRRELAGNLARGIAAAAGGGPD